MKSIPLRQAKPTPDDLKMAKDLLAAFGCIFSGTLPKVDQKYGFDPDEPFDEDDLLAEAEEIEESEIDLEDDEDAAKALRVLLAIVLRGSLDRCVWTLSMLMDPANSVIDPDVAHVALHPRFEKMVAENERMTALCGKLEKALNGLMTNPSINLADKVYDVRDREGKGWDGPDVVAWSESLKAAEEALQAAKGGRGQWRLTN